MWNKIYLSVLAVAFIVMCFFTIYANWWLGRITNPIHVLEGYYHYAGLGSTILGVSTFILLVIANIILWNTRRAWAMWITFVYFVIFVVLRTFWLEKSRYDFENSESLFFTPLVGVILVIAFGAVVFFNQFLNLRLNEKMYPSKVPEEDLQSVEKE